MLYLCTRKWYLARAVRDRSAKPGTAVRIRQVPLKARHSGLFLYLDKLKRENWSLLLESILISPTKQTA